MPVLVLEHKRFCSNRGWRNDGSVQSFAGIEGLPSPVTMNGWGKMRVWCAVAGFYGAMSRCMLTHAPRVAAGRRKTRLVLDNIYLHPIAVDFDVGSCSDHCDHESCQTGLPLRGY